jgi:uncharacterized protein (DUF1786 family)
MKKQDRLTKSVRDELQQHCDIIRKLAADMATGPESVAVLQHGTLSILSLCDAATRAYIFKMVDTLLNAEQSIDRNHYLDANVLQGYEKYKDHIRIGAMTKKLANMFLADLIAMDSLGVDKTEVYRTVIMRLLMELPSESIDEFIQKLAPNLSTKKYTDASRYMYG